MIPIIEVRAMAGTSNLLCSANRSAMTYRRQSVALLASRQASIAMSYERDEALFDYLFQKDEFGINVPGTGVIYLWYRGLSIGLMVALLV